MVESVTKARLAKNMVELGPHQNDVGSWQNLDGGIFHRITEGFRTS